MDRDAASAANHLELVINTKTLLSFYRIVDRFELFLVHVG